MAKRDGGKQSTDDGNVNPTADSPMTTDAMEQRVMAFAEQLGRIVGHGAGENGRMDGP